MSSSGQTAYAWLDLFIVRSVCVVAGAGYAAPRVDTLQLDTGPAGTGTSNGAAVKCYLHSSADLAVCAPSLSGCAAPVGSKRKRQDSIDDSITAGTLVVR